MGGSSWSGLLNTLLVAGLGIVFATILGFLIGIARLSPNWLLARLAGGYVELIRNLPLLFQILFWYLAVLGTLPGPRQSLSLFGEVFINNRGVIVPAPVLAQENAILWRSPSSLRSLAAIVLRIWARRRQNATGGRSRCLLAGLALIVGLAADRFCRRRLSDRVRHAAAAGLQFRRRHAADPGILWRC